MNNDGQIPWNVTAMCALFKPCYVMGKLHVNGDLENLLVSANLTPFGANVEYHPISTKDQARLHLRQESPLRHFLEACFLVWEKAVLLRNGVFMSKESIHKKFSCRKRKNIFMLSWQEKGIKSEHPTTFRKKANEKGGEHRSDLHVETDELDSATHQEERDLEAKHDFWSVSGNFSSCHHAQEREKYKSASGMLVSNLH